MALQLWRKQKSGELGWSLQLGHSGGMCVCLWWEELGNSHETQRQQPSQADLLSVNLPGLILAQRMNHREAGFT